MKKLVNNWLFGELIQSCITYDGMWYLPLDQLADLIMNLIIFAAVALFLGCFVAEGIIAVITLITHHNRKKYGGKYETLQKGRSNHC